MSQKYDAKVVKVLKNDVDNCIRHFLKEYDMSSLDMIKFCLKSVAYYITKFDISFEEDFVELGKKFESQSDPYSLEIFMPLGLTLGLMKEIEDKIKEKK